MNKSQGWLNVYKPTKETSFNVIKKIKKKFKINKIGHAGTLDPLAEGILPIAIGKATKLIQFIKTIITNTCVFTFWKIYLYIIIITNTTRFG